MPVFIIFRKQVQAGSEKELSMKSKTVTKYQKNQQQGQRKAIYLLHPKDNAKPN
jgi:hypothetical protein